MSFTPSAPTPGDALLDLCRNTQRELVLVAPYIKTVALDRLLTSLGDDVRRRFGFQRGVTPARSVQLGLPA